MIRPLATLALLLPVTAMAWEPTGSVWFLDDMPIDYEISDYEEDSLQPGETFEVIQTAYSRWEAAECAQIAVNYIGPTDQNTGFQLNDGISRVSWDDPGDNHGAGTLAVASWRPSFTESRLVQGIAMARTLGGDIVFNDGVQWGNEAQIDSPTCNGLHSVVAVGVHEIGHWWGLGHTCEAIDSCSEASDREATMYYALDTCVNEQAFPNENDLEGITTLYGPGTQIRCSHEIDPGSADTIALGVAPMEVRCRVTERGDDTFTVETGNWFFGDGTEEQPGLDVIHTYETPGSYSITTTVTGTSDACGPWEATVQRRGYVRVCGEPEVSLDAQHVDGRRFQLLNETNITSASCIYQVQWDIFAPNGNLEASLAEWEPEYEFLENGEYRLVLNVGGPAGTAAHELNVNVRNRRGDGYSTCSSLSAGMLSPFVLLLPLVIRRRRD